MAATSLMIHVKGSPGRRPQGEIKADFAHDTGGILDVKVEGVALTLFLDEPTARLLKEEADKLLALIEEQEVIRQEAWS